MKEIENEDRISKSYMLNDEEVVTKSFKDGNSRAKRGLPPRPIDDWGKAPSRVALKVAGKRLAIAVTTSIFGGKQTGSIFSN